MRRASPILPFEAAKSNPEKNVARETIGFIGVGGTLIIYAGGLTYVLDRLWFQKFKNLYEGTLDLAAALAEWAA